MSLFPGRKFAPIALACVLAFGGTASVASAAPAKEKTPKAKSAGSSKRPTARSVNTKLNSTRKTLTSTRRSLTTTRNNLAKAIRDLGALSTRVGSAEGGLTTLLGAAPQLVSGLTQLRDVVQGQIGPNLIQLSDAVTKTIVPNLTAAGNGIKALETALTTQVTPALEDLEDGLALVGTNLGTLSAAVNSNTTGLPALNTRATASEAAATAAAAQAAATEFGVARVYRVRTGEDPVALGSVWTSDIPDDGNNAANASGSVLDAGCQVGDTFAVIGAIRSSESDGTGASDVAGQAGAGLIVTDGTGTLVGGAQTAVSADPLFPGVRAVNIETKSAKTSNDPAADGVEVVETPAIAAPTGGCVVQGTAQFFDFADTPGGTD